MAYKHHERCQTCGRQFVFGQGRYDGKNIPSYKLLVCMTCFEANWDEWGPAFEPTREAHLKVNGIPIPKRNQAGFYPRGL